MKGIDFKTLIEGKKLSIDNAAGILGITKQQLYRIFKKPNVDPYYIERIRNYGGGSNINLQPEQNKGVVKTSENSKEVELLETIVNTQKDTIEILKREVERLKAENIQLQTYAIQKSGKKQH